MQIVMTGGHSGLGLELLKRLVADGHQVGLIVRSRSRLEGLPAEVSGAVVAWEADLSVQQQVADVARSIRQDWTHVDVLFNNAGLLGDELRHSAQGNELQLEINALAPLLLTRHLKPALDAADAPLVVSTATENMHTMVPDLKHLIDVQSFRRLLGGYVHSKSAMVHLMNDLSAQPGWDNVRFLHVNPGANLTGMTRGSGMPVWLKPLAPLLFGHPSKGGNLLYEAAFSPGHSGENRAFLHKNRVTPMKVSLPGDARSRLLAGITIAMDPVT